MVSGDATTMTLPAKIVKNKEPITLALTAELTAVLKKQFRQTGQPVFDATNLRREWASATVAAKCPFAPEIRCVEHRLTDRKSTRLNSSHRCISYAVFCLIQKNLKK